MSVHPTAVIEDGAELGANVTVGACAYIEKGAQLEDGCVVGPHAVIYGSTTLGEGCRVHAGAVLGDVPQDLAFEGGESRVRIGARCVIREGVTIHRGTKTDTTTTVGDDCFLMAYSHLGHNVELGNRVIVVNNAMLGGYVVVEDGAFISGKVGVHQFCRVGRLAMLGGNSIATKDVPPFAMTRTAALNEVVGLNVVGMRRAGMTAEERQAVKRAFETIYRSGLNVSQAIASLREEGVEGPAAEFITFIEASKRGICGFGRGSD